MKTTSIQPNQSLLDMALMACGTLEGAMHIMAANEESITADVAPGVMYIIPSDVPSDNYSLQYLQQNNIIIGTRADTP